MVDWFELRNVLMYVEKTRSKSKLLGRCNSVVVTEEVISVLPESMIYIPCSRSSHSPRSIDGHLAKQCACGKERDNSISKCQNAQQTDV